MQFGITRNGSGDFLEHPINQVKNVLHREAMNVRYYENLKFMLNCYNTQTEAENALRLHYAGKHIALPPFKIQLFSCNLNDLYVNNFGTSNFDVFSIYMMNLCSLRGIRRFIEQGNSYSQIKDKPDEVKGKIFEERKDWLPKAVKIWRNKVAAHYAAADPKSDDNIITLMSSLSSMPQYRYPRYYVSSTFIFINGEKSQLEEWSVTRVYDELTDKLELRPLPPLINTMLTRKDGEIDPLISQS